MVPHIGRAGVFGVFLCTESLPPCLLLHRPIADGRVTLRDYKMEESMATQPSQYSADWRWSSSQPGEALNDKKILIIDDDRILCQLVTTILTHAGAAPHAAFGGEQGLREFYNQRPDLVLLDHMMPGLNGFEILKRIRELSDVPIIMLSAIDSEEEIVRCLTAGADDYVTKPYQPQVLVARATAAMRRLAQPQEKARNIVYDDGYLMFDLQARVVKAAGKDVRLSATEFKLLSYLVVNAGRVCSFAQIFEAVWGDTTSSTNENIHTFVYQLRQKLEPDAREPTYIISVRSIGYRFQLAHR